MTSSPVAVDRAELLPGARSFHARRTRNESRETPVANPVHVIFYRTVQPGLVEILCVLHERMEPGRHVGSAHSEQTLRARPRPGSVRLERAGRMAGKDVFDRYLLALLALAIGE